MKMIRSILTICILLTLSHTVQAFNNLAYVSIPKMGLTSSARFASMDNDALTSAFLDCGSSGWGLFSVDVTFQSTGVYALCASGNANFTCDTAGSAASSTAVTVTTGFNIVLGYRDGVRIPAEVTTGTKFTGNLYAVRTCTREYNLRN